MTADVAPAKKAVLLLVGDVETTLFFLVRTWTLVALLI